MAGIEGDHLFAVRNGLFVLPHLPVKNGASVPAFGESGIFRGDPVQNCKRFRKLFPFHREAGGLREAKGLPSRRVEPEIPKRIGGDATNGAGWRLQRAQQLVLSAEPGQVERGRNFLGAVAGHELAVKAFPVPGAVLPQVEGGVRDEKGGKKSVEPAQERCEKPVHVPNIGTNRPAARRSRKEYGFGLSRNELGTAGSQPKQFDRELKMNTNMFAQSWSFALRAGRPYSAKGYSRRVRLVRSVRPFAVRYGRLSAGAGIC